MDEKKLKTIQSLIPFLEPYPIWVKSLVVIWIVLSAVLLASLLLAQPKKIEPAAVASPSFSPGQPQKKEQVLVSKAEHKTSMQTASITLAQYFETYEKIKNRFFESDQFVEELRNKTVSWCGYVVTVQKSYQNGVAVTLDVNEDLTGKMVFVHFPENLATKAYALQQRDYVEFTGEIYSGPPTKLEIRGETFSVLIK